MFQYQRFLIRDTDRFDPLQFPRLDEDLAEIETKLASVPALLKAEVLLAYLEEKTIKAEWAAANPALAKIITSDGLPLRDLKDLLQASSNNPAFKSELESYIRNWFKVSTTTY